jgi:hypothetical protein
MQGPWPATAQQSLGPIHRGCSLVHPISASLEGLGALERVSDSASLIRSALKALNALIRACTKVKRRIASHAARLTPPGALHI